MRVILNDAISLRGPSGTARASQLIYEALLQGGHDVQRVQPSRASPAAVSKIQFGLWDFYGPARYDGDVTVSPANTGRAGRSRPHVLWMQDTMVLDRPDLFDRSYANYARVAFPLSVREASLVVVTSTYARDRVLARWPKTRSC